MIKKSNSLKKRIITAAILAPLVLAITFFAPSKAFAVMVLVFLVLATYEWLNLASVKHLALRAIYIYLLAALYLFIIVNIEALPVLWLFAISACWWLWVSFKLFTQESFEQNTQKQSVFTKLVAGVLTLLPACVAMFLIHSLYGPWAISYIFLMIWGADIGAYFSGKRFGHHKLAAKLSPGKTIEGVVGGLLFVAICAALVGVAIFAETLDIVKFVGIAIVVVIFSVVGDLYESSLKREAGVKDSSQLLPGHGGVLDRLDSMFSTVPLFVLLCAMSYQVI